ncbi:unnamed protein product [Heterosigma akashiwo]
MNPHMRATTGCRSRGPTCTTSPGYCARTSAASTPSASSTPGCRTTLRTGTRSTRSRSWCWGAPGASTPAPTR